MRRLCGLRLVDPTVVAMAKEPVLAGNRVAGYVTSAGFGYSTGESLASAYLPAALAHEDQAVTVAISVSAAPPRSSANRAGILRARLRV
jgi:glycine cleavage system aminomethyltransferase T